MLCFKTDFAKGQKGQGPKFQKLHIHSLSIPGRRNWAYFHCMGSGFRDNGWFSKLPYLAMKLSHWPKFQKWHIYSLSTPEGRNWAYFCSTGSGFRDTGQFSKLPYLGMKLSKWPKFEKLHIHSLSPPMESKLSLFLLYVQRFLRYVLIFKISVFGHESWQVDKVPKVAHILSTPGSRNWAYFHSMGSGFRDTGPFSKLPYLGMKLGKWSNF